MPIGWTLSVLAPGGEVELEHLGDAEAEWFGAGPAGDSMGALTQVLTECAVPGTDPEWIEAAVAAIGRELEAGASRSALLVQRGAGSMFHASRAVNHDSIARHGLDWRRMTALGIAGSARPERPGIFLCSNLHDARWFATMPRRERVDIWRVRVDGHWMESDPGASGGAADAWMIAPCPIPSEAVTLCESDSTRGNAARP